MTLTSRGWLTRAALVAAFAWTLVVTVLRTVRWPNDFAEAHWLLDYRIGLVKRGLPGEVLALATGLVGGRPTEGLIADVSALIFGLLVIALLIVAVRIVLRAGWSTGAVIVGFAFLSSSYVVMAAHLVGYFDHLVVLATTGALALMLRGQPWWAAGVLAVAVFAHEHTLVLGFPLLVLAWLLVNDGRRSRALARLPVLPLAVPLAAFAGLATAGLFVRADVFQDTFARHLETFPFVGGDMHLLVPEWLSVGIVEGAGSQLHRFVERLISRDLYSLILPTVVALMALALDRFSFGSRLRVAAFIGAVLAPQLLHMAGWDTVRIWTFSIIVAGLGTWVVAEAGRPRRVDPSPAVPLVAMTALIINAILTTPLYDGLSEWHPLGTRLWFYGPVLLVSLWLLLAPSSVRPSAEGTMSPADLA